MAVPMLPKDIGTQGTWHGVTQVVPDLGSREDAVSQVRDCVTGKERQGWPG